MIRRLLLCNRNEFNENKSQNALCNYLIIKRVNILLYEIALDQKIL